MAVAEPNYIGCFLMGCGDSHEKKHTAIEPTSSDHDFPAKKPAKSGIKRIPRIEGDAPLYIPHILAQDYIIADIICDFLMDDKDRASFLTAFPAHPGLLRKFNLSRVIVNLSQTVGIAFENDTNRVVFKHSQFRKKYEYENGYYCDGNGENGFLQIMSNPSAHAVRTEDGEVFCWGNKNNGGEIPSKYEKDLKNNIVQIVATNRAFSAQTKYGGIISWGNPSWGGDQGKYANLLQIRVEQIVSTAKAFAALRDGKVITWGAKEATNPGKIRKKISKDIKSICSTYGAFSALNYDGLVYSWGKKCYGGEHTINYECKKLLSNRGAFCVLSKKGKIECWGSPQFGGSLPSELKNANYAILNVENVGSNQFKATLEISTRKVIWPRKEE